MRFLHLAMLVLTTLLTAAAAANAGLPDVAGLVQDLAERCYGPPGGPYIGGPQCGLWP